MSFFVDIVTEDTFYENLTLGVVKLLESSPCVRNVQVEKRSPCERSLLSSWEQRHCCLLPEDVKNFYTSIDGFLLTWSLDIAGEEFPVGRMSVNEFAALKRFVGTKEQQSEAESKDAASTTSSPTLGPNYKLFELDQCANARVFLVYHIRPDLDSEPSIWLYHNSCNDDSSNYDNINESCEMWYHLSDNFTKYLRMMLVHLGLPLWQYCIAGISLPTWVEQTYYLVGPHLLPNAIKLLPSISTSLWKDGPHNSIDPAIFKNRDNKQKNQKKK